MKTKFVQPLILITISILFFMKWVVPNFSKDNQPTKEQIQQLEENNINQEQINVMSSYIELMYSQTNVTGFNPTIKQIYDFGFFSDDFPLSGKLFFSLNILLTIIISLKLFKIFTKDSVNKFISYFIVTLNTVLLFYPIYLIYWLNSTLENIDKFFKTSSTILGSNEWTGSISSIMKINYIVYIIIILYIINLVIEIMTTKYKLNKI